MSSVTKYIEEWYRALSSPRGIIIQVEPVENLELVKMQLYAARKEAMDEALQSLSIVVSPTVPGELWIIKQEQPNGQGVTI